MIFYVFVELLQYGTCMHQSNVLLTYDLHLAMVNYMHFYQHPELPRDQIGVFICQLRRNCGFWMRTLKIGVLTC